MSTKARGGGGYFVWGTIHHPNKVGKDYKGIDYRDDEFERMAKFYETKPVFMSHKHSSSIGWVVHVERAENDAMDALLYVTSKTEMGRETIKGLNNGTLTGLSLGQRMEKVDGEVRKIMPTEISVVTKGGRPGTSIKFFQGDGEVHVLNKSSKSQTFPTKSQIAQLEQQIVDKENYNNNKLKMSDQTTPPPQATENAVTPSLSQDPNLPPAIQQIILAAKQLKDKGMADADIDKYIIRMMEDSKKYASVDPREWSAYENYKKEQKEQAERAVKAAEEKRQADLSRIQEIRAQAGSLPIPEHTLRAIDEKLQITPPEIVAAYADAMGNYVALKREEEENKRLKLTVEKYEQEKQAQEKSLALMSQTERFPPPQQQQQRPSGLSLDFQQGFQNSQVGSTPVQPPQYPQQFAGLTMLQQATSCFPDQPPAHFDYLPPSGRRVDYRVQQNYSNADMNTPAIPAAAARSQMRVVDAYASADDANTTVIDEMFQRALLANVSIESIPSLEGKFTS